MFRLSRTSVIAWTAVLVGVAGLSYIFATAVAPAAAKSPNTSAALVEFTADGKLKQPVGYRNWVFVGTPLTPNDLNGGAASFPEFHNVYIDPESFKYYQKTGEYRDGTVLVKELTSVGAKEAPSGRGYFEGEFTGLEAAVKDPTRFKEEQGSWGYFSFGHKYPLKAEAEKNSTITCNKCHDDSAIKGVFSQYYPVLRAAAPTSK